MSSMVGGGLIGVDETIEGSDKIQMLNKTAATRKAGAWRHLEEEGVARQQLPSDEAMRR